MTTLTLLSDEDAAAQYVFASMASQERDFTRVEDLSLDPDSGCTDGEGTNEGKSPVYQAETAETVCSPKTGPRPTFGSLMLKKTSNPRACRLCNYAEDAADREDESVCTRCGLFTSPKLDQSRYYLQEAARAYRFKVVASMSGLIDDLAEIVVSYLIWFRGPADFRIGHAVDAQDFRGKWFEATVVDTKEDHVLVKYKGFSSKWNTWIHRLSTTLAPSKTRTGDRAGLLEEGDSTDGSTSSGSGSGAGSAGSYGGSSSGSGGGYSDGDESA